MQPEADPPPVPAGETRFDRTYRWIALIAMAALTVAGLIYVALRS